MNWIEALSYLLVVAVLLGYFYLFKIYFGNPFFGLIPFIATALVLFAISLIYSVFNTLESGLFIAGSLNMTAVAFYLLPLAFIVDVLT